MRTMGVWRGVIPAYFPSRGGRSLQRDDFRGQGFEEWLGSGLEKEMIAGENVQPKVAVGLLAPGHHVLRGSDVILGAGKGPDGDREGRTWAIRVCLADGKIGAERRYEQLHELFVLENF